MANPTLMSDGLSILYNGGGTANALLASKTTSALLVAAAAQKINSGLCDTLELWLVNATAAQSCTLVVGEFAGPIPTVANMIRLREVAVGTAEQTVTADRAAWSLTTATEYPAKAPIRIRVQRSTTIKIALLGTGTWYMRIVASKSLLGDPGEVNEDSDAILAAMIGSGASAPLGFADPVSNDYTAAIATPGRICYRLRVIVGDSGVVVSLDNGTTASFTIPPNSADDIGVAIPAASNVKVKRYTADVAMTNLIVEVR